VYLLDWIFITFFRPGKNLKSEYGPWALITGSTDGIGKAFAFQLAEKGLNLILVSRNPGKLRRVSGEIRAQFPNTEIKILEVDFTGDVAAGVREMEKMMEEVEVGVLVNNVGITYPGARYFHEVEEEIWMNIVRVNVESTSMVTKAVLKGMIKRRRGAILNIGSGASLVVPSHPLYAIYAATKAYVDQFSRCLYVEYMQTGIHVQCQVPLYVSTKMASQIALIDKSSLFVPTAESYVRTAIRKIGYEPRCTPYWAHSVQWFLASLLPDSLLDAWRLSIGIRRRNSL
jgi:17beta-estradiol 17-dehydrogenase / very-long-chain 3-oxoacyl-CoA reductase